MANRNNTLIIYTLQNCIYCNVLKGELNKLGINYIEVSIDDGNQASEIIGNTLEFRYETESYPIVELNYRHQLNHSFISKTNLESSNKIHIFNTIEELIIKIQQYAL